MGEKALARKQWRAATCARCQQRNVSTLLGVAVLGGLDLARVDVVVGPKRKKVLTKRRPLRLHVERLIVVVQRPWESPPSHTPRTTLIPSIETESKPP